MNTFELMVLIERLLWTIHPSPDARTSHLRTLSKIIGSASAPFLFHPPPKRPSEPPIMPGFFALSTPRCRGRWLRRLNPTRRLCRSEPHIMPAFSLPSTPSCEDL